MSQGSNYVSGKFRVAESDSVLRNVPERHNFELQFTEFVQNAGCIDVYLSMQKKTLTFIQD